MDYNKIVCYDYVEYMNDVMDPESVDLTVTSPPPYDNLRDYNGYKLDCKLIAEGLYRVTKKGGVVVWVVGDKILKGNKSLTSFRQAIIFQEIGFNVHDVMIYKKKNTPFMRSNAYTNCYEYMFVFSKGSPITFNPLQEKTVRSGEELLVHNKKADGVNKKRWAGLIRLKQRQISGSMPWAWGGGETTKDKIAFKHPAVFPEKLALDYILSWSNEGDLVFDPMCGSGTTCKMAMLNNRKYLGCDISEEYVGIARKRIAMFECRQLRLDV